jgi:hypothetical protein
LRTLLALADISLLLGIIGEAEYEERVAIAIWMADDSSAIDPRGYGDVQEARENRETDSLESSEVKFGGKGGADLERNDWIQFVAFKTWYFTGSDPDSYPSVPHGHLYSADRAWPKLNPYTGRVFKAKHQEDVSLRFDKRKMRKLWRTEAFRDFCRSHILSYIENHPHHRFGVRHVLRLPRW